MVSEPEIVKEMREAERVGKLSVQSQDSHEESDETYKTMSEEISKTDELLDEMWFNIWKCL